MNHTQKRKRKYYLKHKNKIRKYDRLYHLVHRDEILKKDHERYIKNIVIIKQRKRKYYLKHRRKLIEYAFAWQKDHTDMVRISKYAYLCRRLKRDINFKLARSLRNRLGLAVKKNSKSGSAVRDLGCSIEFFKRYIQSKFKKDMSWDNWGKVWQLDHVIPLWKFDLTNRKQLLKAVHYTNLQPLTIKDHQIKSNKELSEYYDEKKTSSIPL